MNDDLILEKLKTYCAYQERCAYDVIKKLNDLGVPENKHQAVVDYLKEFDFLNEQRFLDSYINGKINLKLWGKYKIVSHLRQKHINSFLLEKTLNKVPYQTFYENAKRLAVSKLNGSRLTLKEKGKIQRYLYQKGYENDIIYEVLNELSK